MSYSPWSCKESDRAEHTRMLPRRVPDRIRINKIMVPPNRTQQWQAAGTLNEIQQLSLLINNAGFGKLGYVWEIDPNVQRDMVDLNCGALTALTSLVIPYMPAGGGILNV